jgi:hypothetical protein
MNDWYSKLMLTVIAIAVVVGQGIVDHVQADRAEQNIRALNPGL